MGRQSASCGSTSCLGSTVMWRSSDFFCPDQNCAIVAQRRPSPYLLQESLQGHANPHLSHHLLSPKQNSFHRNNICTRGYTHPGFVQLAACQRRDGSTAAKTSTSALYKIPRASISAVSEISFRRRSLDLTICAHGDPCPSDLLPCH
jgi:hypothetical protein